MPITITGVVGLGGSPPTSLLVSGTVETCERVEVVTSCSAAPVTVEIATGGLNTWNVVLPNDKQCPCGATVDVSARCTLGAPDATKGRFTIVCSSQASCFDNPDEIFGSDTCVTSLSKNARGKMALQESTRHVCERTDCVTLRTHAVLKVTLTGNAACDGALAKLLKGSLTVQTLATAYEKDGLGRGVHAGDFHWVAAGIEIEGRMSGITNAGLVRATPFKPFEKCRAEGILVGRLCGRVVKTTNRELRRAQIVATYRLKTTSTPRGANGAVVGTIEGVVITPC